MRMYMHSFHWILLCIRIEEHKVLVYDSLRQDKSKYQDIIEVVNTAWSRYLHKHIGLPIGEIEPLHWVTDFRYEYTLATNVIRNKHQKNSIS